MEFTLTYRGPLRSNRGPLEKQQIRRHFHRQLSLLWTQVPLSGYRDFVSTPAVSGKANVVEHYHGFHFAPLVSEKIKFVASLRILLLRTEPPGTLFSQSGDIDNRIKTLLDALKVPHEPTALPPNDSPQDGERPFFCLLQDDSLIVNLSIETDRLLEPVTDQAEVLALVRVRTAPVQSLIASLGL